MRVPDGTVCVVPRGKTLATSKPCGKPAARIVTFGCRHEHISTKVVCDFHADFVLKGKGTDGQQVICQRCHVIDGHKCPLGAKEETE